MEIGNPIKIHKNVPQVIPVTLPKRIQTGDGEKVTTPKPEEKPIHVPDWPVKVPERVEK